MNPTPTPNRKRRPGKPQAQPRNCPCDRPPDIGRATNHLEGLRRYLLAIGHPAEANVVRTVLDQLIPQRICPVRRAELGR